MMRKKDPIRVKRIAPPAITFMIIYIFFITIPTAYIAFSDYYSNYWYNLSFGQYRDSANLSLLVSSVFFFCFMLGYFFLRLSAKTSNHHRDRLHKHSGGIAVPPVMGGGSHYHYRIKKDRFFFYMTLGSIALVWIYTAFGGYEKISQFGQDISKLDYRLIGFNENRITTALLQIARRLTLPFCAVYFILLYSYSNKYNGLFILTLLFSFLMGIIVTLDRGPFMLFLVMFGYIYFCMASNAAKVMLNGLLLVVAMFMLGGLLSFIQHNIQDFSFTEVVDTGNAFLVNRAWMAPNFVPIELSYGLFGAETPKLWLEHARIVALFTGNYVGTLEDNSLFVGPVGAVADIWRNTGFAGIIFIGFLLGLYFYKIEKMIGKSDPIIKVSASFTIITLIFYFIYGTFFSQGVFLQLIFLYFILKFTASDGRKYKK